MYPLIKFFVELALLRRGPQDLPVSSALLLVLSSGGVLVGALNGQDIFGGLGPAAGANLLDMVLTMVMLFVLLQFRGQAARWQQTATAFFGLGLLAGLLMFVVRVLADALGILDIAVLADVVLAVWLHVSLGHVLRNALEIPLMAGVIIVLAYTMMAFNVIVQIFPVATAA